MKTILFVNHQGRKCGVYQYGIHVFNAIKKLVEFDFEYIECTNAAILEKEIAKLSPDAVLYNYHECTLSFVSKDFLARNKGHLNLCLAHELSQAAQDTLDGSSFQYYIFGNPSFHITNSRIYKIGRLLPSYVNRNPLSEIPVIGSYGFAVGVKGYIDIVRLVEKEFHSAIIRFNIAPNSYLDPNGEMARRLAIDIMQSSKKQQIKIEITHEFFDDQGLLNFLAKNTVNVFMYDPFAIAYVREGISSAVDQAISVRRPIAITSNPLFRHLFHLTPSILFKNNDLQSFFRHFKNEKQNRRNLIRALWKNRLLKSTTLQAIIQNGTAPLESLYSEWNEENFLLDFSSILNDIFHKQNRPLA